VELAEYVKGSCGQIDCKSKLYNLQTVQLHRQQQNLSCTVFKVFTGH